MSERFSSVTRRESDLGTSFTPENEHDGYKLQENGLWLKEDYKSSPDSPNLLKSSGGDSRVEKLVATALDNGQEAWDESGVSELGDATNYSEKNEEISDALSSDNLGVNGELSGDGNQYESEFILPEQEAAAEAVVEKEPSTLPHSEAVRLSHVRRSSVDFEEYYKQEKYATGVRPDGQTNYNVAQAQADIEREINEAFRSEFEAIRDSDDPHYPLEHMRWLKSLSPEDQAKLSINADFLKQASGNHEAVLVDSKANPKKRGLFKRLKSSLADAGSGAVEAFKVAGEKASEATANLKAAFVRPRPEQFSSPEEYETARKGYTRGMLGATALSGMAAVGAVAQFSPMVAGVMRAKWGIDIDGLETGDVERVLSTQDIDTGEGSSVLNPFERFRLGGENGDNFVETPDEEPAEVEDTLADHETENDWDGVYNPENESFYDENKVSEGAFGAPLQEAIDAAEAGHELTEEQEQIILDDLEQNWQNSPSQRAAMLAEFGLLADESGELIKNPTAEDINRMARVWMDDPELNIATQEILMEHVNKPTVHMEVHQIDYLYNSQYQAVGEDGRIEIVSSYNVDNGGVGISFYETVYDDDGNEIGKVEVARVRANCRGQLLESHVEFGPDKIIPAQEEVSVETVIKEIEKQQVIQHQEAQETVEKEFKEVVADRPVQEETEEVDEVEEPQIEERSEEEPEPEVPEEEPPVEVEEEPEPEPTPKVEEEPELEVEDDPEVEEEAPEEEPTDDKFEEDDPDEPDQEEPAEPEEVEEPPEVIEEDEEPESLPEPEDDPDPEPEAPEEVPAEEVEEEPEPEPTPEEPEPEAPEEEPVEEPTPEEPEPAPEIPEEEPPVEPEPEPETPPVEEVVDEEPTDDGAKNTENAISHDNLPEGGVSNEGREVTEAVEDRENSNYSEHDSIDGDNLAETVEAEPQPEQTTQQEQERQNQAETAPEQYTEQAPASPELNQDGQHNVSNTEVNESGQVNERSAEDVAAEQAQRAAEQAAQEAAVAEQAAASEAAAEADNQFDGREDAEGNVNEEAVQSQDDEIARMQEELFGDGGGDKTLEQNQDN